MARLTCTTMLLACMVTVPLYNNMLGGAWWSLYACSWGCCCCCAVFPCTQATTTMGMCKGAGKPRQQLTPPPRIRLPCFRQWQLWDQADGGVHTTHRARPSLFPPPWVVHHPICRTMTCQGRVRLCVPSTAGDGWQACLLQHGHLSQWLSRRHVCMCCRLRSSCWRCSKIRRPHTLPLRLVVSCTALHLLHRIPLRSVPGRAGQQRPLTCACPVMLAALPAMHACGSVLHE